MSPPGGGALIAARCRGRWRRGRARSASSAQPWMMPWTTTLLMMYSVKIARIGLKSSPPKRGRTRRKMRRNGSQMSRRKPSTLSVGARVRRAHADREQQLDDDVQDDQQRVDVDQRRQEAGDFGARAGEHQRHRVPRSSTASSASLNASRSPARSSASRPRAVRPPGEDDLAAHGQRVVAAAAQQLGGAGERLHDQLGALRGGDAAAHAGVDLRLGDERDVRGRARHQAHRDVHQRVVEHDERARARANSSPTAASSAIARRHPRRRRRRPACTTAPWRTSTGSEGMKRYTGRSGRPPAAPPAAWRRGSRRPRARAGADFARRPPRAARACGTAPRARRAAGDLGVARQRLAADLRREALARARRSGPRTAAAAPIRAPAPEPCSRSRSDRFA